MEKPYIPFYRPYGMSEEEYEYEVKLAEQKLIEYEIMLEEMNKVTKSVKLSENFHTFIKDEILYLNDSNPNHQFYAPRNVCGEYRAHVDNVISKDIVENNPTIFNPIANE